MKTDFSPNSTITFRALLVLLLIGWLPPKITGIYAPLWFSGVAFIIGIISTFFFHRRMKKEESRTDYSAYRWEWEYFFFCVSLLLFNYSIFFMGVN